MNQQHSEYSAFLENKTHSGSEHGFDPVWVPDSAFPFQRALIEWTCRKGRAACFADCGLGKTMMQLTWAENVARKTGGRVLVLAPLAVGSQTVREGEKFGIEVAHRRDELHKGDRIVVTNYERLHHFNPEDFSAVVCDESSILKSFGGETRKQVTRFISKTPYRLLCTATAAPNDYIELGTSSEALGELSNSEMLKRFFKYLDDKGQKSEQRLQDSAEAIIKQDGSYYQKLAYRVAQTIGQWRLKHHAVVPFWRWVSSWARACRTPSDLGFDDGDFILPKLTENHHIITPNEPPPGMLFNCPAFGLGAERDERRRTLDERCDFVASLVNHNRPAVVWCHMNAEGDRLSETIPGARQIAGKTPEDEKLEIYDAFANGSLRVLIIKPKIGAWGLNWQHCNHVVTFATHSYEQHYQSVRRCWRFGQKRPVQVDVISTEGESRVLGNLKRKGERADAMFQHMIREMNNAVKHTRHETIEQVEAPKWLASNSTSPKLTRSTSAIV